MSEDNNNQENQKPAKNKEALLGQINSEFDKQSYQETKKKIQDKLKQRKEHEKSIKLIDTEIDELWDKHTKGF